MENKEDLTIGVAHQIPEFDQKIQDLTEEWNKKSEEKINLSKITLFLLSSTDILICTIDKLLDKGIDKKATVLMGLEQIYVFIQRSPFVPIWLKPFLNVIRSYIIYTLLSVLIDWAVSKYKQGSWKNKEKKSIIKKNQIRNKKYKK